MFSYMRTSTVNGQYAYRAGDGQWYIVDDKTGEVFSNDYDTRQSAIAAMQVK